MAMRRLCFLFFAVLASTISEHNELNKEYVLPMDEIDSDDKSFGADEEYIRHIYSMIDEYRGDMTGGRFIIETNALIDTKFKTWKRNVDLINSLLALPKGMNDAGR